MQGSSCVFISYREPLPVTWYCCTWWTPAPTTGRRSLKSSTSSKAKCVVKHDMYCFQKINQRLLHSPAFLCHSINRRDKTKEGKERHKKDRTSRKPASEKGANHSSSQPTETEHLSSGVKESLPPVDKRGPTIPRNTGQRYSALSHQGAEPKPHITFSSLN